MPSHARKTRFAALAQRQVVAELRKIRAILKPEENKAWYEKLYAKAVAVAKYVGIPALIIAAIGPTLKLLSDLVEYRNKTVIQQVYLDRASDLLAEGSIDRANKLLTTLENQKDFDARLQYYKSKVLIAMAIQQARNYTEAFDTASILSEIAEKNTLYLPSLGTTEDLMELNFALIDIDLAQKNFAEAKKRIKSMENRREFADKPTFTPNIEYRLGNLDVLEHKSGEGEKHLLIARDLGKKTGQKLLAANAAFQLGNIYQTGNRLTALAYYKESAEVSESLADKFGLLKTYNNMAAVYLDDENYGEVRNYGNKAQVVATEVGDDLGYARAAVSIATADEIEHNYGASIRRSLEALGVFKQQGDLLGLVTSANVLAKAYEAAGDFADALAYAKQEFDASLELKEPKQVAASCGTLSNVYSDTGDRPEMAFASFCAAMLINLLEIEAPSETEKHRDAFMSRFKGVVARSEQRDTFLKSIEARVQDIFLKLNLKSDVIHNEITSLQVSSSVRVSQTAELPELAQIELAVKMRILCELRHAVEYVNATVIEGPSPDRTKSVAKYVIPLDWIAVTSLSFQLDEFSGLNSDGSAGADSVDMAFTPRTLSRTVTASQSRILGFGGSLSSTATRIDKFDPSYSIKSLMAPQGPYSFCRRSDPLAALKADLSFSPFNVESDLGILKWLYGAIVAGALLDGDSVTGPTEPVSLEIRFVIVSNGNMTPTWKIVSVPATTSSAFSTAGRTRMHDLIITIGPNDTRTLNSHLASQIGQASGATGPRLTPQE